MFFLKYRPKTIAELDLDEVRDQLGSILKRKEIPQAFLFSGPKGAGKTSAARILAKVVNCLNLQGFEPCNQCRLCRQINSDSSLDVLEIDAASNRGIDDVRQLKEKVAFAPIDASYKVYIIDEAHMLTKEAFNALLKTLEEPPDHVIFILCTTNPEKIIATVLSRLIRINFSKGSDKEVKRCLDKVISGEKLSVEPKVIEAIIRLSDGGFRDAQKILENLVLSSGKKLLWNKVKKKLNYWQKQQPEFLLAALASGDLNEALSISQVLASEGAGFADYLAEVLNTISRMIFLKSTPKKKEGTLSQLSEIFTFSRLVKLSRLLSRALLEQKSTVLPQLPLQLAVTEFVGKAEAGDKISSKDNDSSANSSNSPKKRSVRDKSPAVGVEISSGGEKRGAKTLLSLADLESKWQDLLEAVRPMNHSVAAFLRASRPKTIEHGDTLVLEVFYKFHKDKLEEERNRKIVETGLEQICGHFLKTRCVLGENKGESGRDSSSKNVLSAKKNSADDKTSPAEGEDLYQIAKEIFGS